MSKKYAAGQPKEEYEDGDEPEHGWQISINPVYYPAVSGRIPFYPTPHSPCGHPPMDAVECYCYPCGHPPLDAVECYCYPYGHPPMDAVECYCYPCGHPPMDAVECYCSSSL